MIRFWGYLILGLAVCLASCNSGAEKTVEKKQVASETAAVDSLIILTEKIEENAKDPQMYLNRAQYYFRHKKWPEAMADLSQVMELGEVGAEQYLLAADLFYVSGNYQKAKEALDACYVKYPENTSVNYKIAEVYLILKDYQKVFDHVNNALKINKHEPKGYFIKGMAYKEIGDSVKAVSSFMTATEQDPQYYHAFMQLGLIYSGKGDDLALEFFKNAISVNKSLPEPYYGIAWHLQNSGRLDEALGAYEELAKIFPGHADATYNQGFIYLEYLGEPLKAKSYFDHLMRLYPQEPRYCYMVGLSLEELGEKRLAEEHYRKTLVVDPNYQLAKEALKLLKNKS